MVWVISMLVQNEWVRTRRALPERPGPSRQVPSCARTCRPRSLGVEAAGQRQRESVSSNI